MEENENKSSVEEKASAVKGKATEILGKVVEFVKNHKKPLLGLLVVILVVWLAGSLLFGGKQRVVKKFVSALNSGNAKKAINCIDFAGSTVFYQLDDDEYDDFWDEYKDYTDSDEWEELKEEIDEELDDTIEDLEDSLDDSDAKIKIKKFKGTKKLGKNLWEVKAQIQTTDEDGDKSTNTTKFYVMKKGLKYYIVSGLGASSMF